eukprot:jgi/Botrbrau1/10269/Bobra.0140s0022.1
MACTSVVCTLSCPKRAKLARRLEKPAWRGSVTTCFSGGSTQTVPAVEDEKLHSVRAEVTRRIQKLGRLGRAKEAVAELAQMARLGVQPDTQAATALLDACVRAGKLDMALSVFEELFGTGVSEPDEVTFRVLVRGYGDCEPPRWLAISTLLQQMDKKYSIKPSILVYNALLEICARTRDQERGSEVIAQMHKAGIEPDEVTVDTVKNRKALRTLLRKTFDM